MPRIRIDCAKHPRLVALGFTELSMYSPHDDITATEDEIVRSVADRVEKRHREECAILDGATGEKVGE